MKKPKINVSILRAGGLGIDGTYRNANHHAEKVLPFLDMFKAAIPDLGFADWFQGHNVHELVTLDNRKFTLRAYTRQNEYKGIRLSLRLSRSHEIRLMDAETAKQIADMISMLNDLARPARGDKTALLSPDQYLQVA